MANRTIVAFEEQTGITTQSDNFIVETDKDVTALCALTAGTPTTGIRLQITVDQPEKIMAGTALWINSPQGNRTSSGAEKVQRPITGIRAVATDGTWTLQVRQA